MRGARPRLKSDEPRLCRRALEPVSGLRSKAMIDSPDVGRTALAVTVFLIITFSLCIWLAGKTKVPHAPSITVLTMLAHLTVSIPVYLAFGLYANDAVAYDTGGIQIAQRLGGDTTVTVQTSSGKEGWVWALGYIYHWFGHQPVLGLILNAGFASAVVPVVGLACVELGWRFAATRAMWIVGFAPPLFIWSTFLLREAAVNLTVSVVLAASAAYLRTRRLRWLILPAFADLLLVWLRGPVSVIVLVGVVLGLVLAGRLGAGRIRPSYAVLFAALAIIAVPVSLKLFGTFNASLETINQSRAALARSASSSFGAVSSSSSLSGSVVLAIRQLPDAALGPFPWQWGGGLGGMLNAIDALTWLVFARFGVRAWRLGIVRRGRWICACPAGLLLLAIALTSGNYGTLVRIRAMALPLLASLIAAGMVRPRTAVESAVEAGGPPTALRVRRRPNPGDGRAMTYPMDA